MRLAATVRASSRGPLLQVLKTSVSAIAAWLISGLVLDQTVPIFAAIAALLVVAPSVNQSLAKGVERSFGVILGVVIAYLAGLVFGSSSPVVLATIVVSLLVAWALKLTAGSTVQIPISAMLVLTVGAQTPQYAADRIFETVIGAVVGLVVNVSIVPPVLTAPARLSVERLTSGVASALDQLSRALVEHRDPAQLDELLDEARELRSMQAVAAEDLEVGVESLTLNPRAGSHREVLERDGALLERLGVLVTRIIGMTRAVHDNYDERLRAEPIAGSIAEELSRAAHDVRLMSRAVGGAGVTTRRTAWWRPGASARDSDRGWNDGESTMTGDLPALTGPLVIRRPDSGHWILVGSLLEDLRRIREEIIGRPGE